MPDEAAFRSTNLSTGEFDAETGEMTITFNSGRTYLYRGVEPAMWERLKSAPSAGIFLNTYFPQGEEI